MSMFLSGGSVARGLKPTARHIQPLTRLGGGVAPLPIRAAARLAKTAPVGRLRQSLNTESPPVPLDRGCFSRRSKLFVR